MIKQLWKYGVVYVFLLTSMKTIRCMIHHTPWAVIAVDIVLFLYAVLLIWVNVDRLFAYSKGRKTALFIFRKWYRCAFLLMSILFIMHEVMFLDTGTDVTVTKAEMELMVEENKQNKEQLSENLAERLAKEYYSNATDEEKVEILLLVALNEIEYLGIEAPSIEFQKLASNIGAYYQGDTNAITINEIYLNDEKCVINSLVHEMYHAYQYACIESYDENSDLLWNRKVSVWREEYDNLHNNLNTDDGLIAYYLQESEISAREYAEERAQVYYKYILEE